MTLGADFNLTAKGTKRRRKRREVAGPYRDQSSNPVVRGQATEDEHRTVAVAPAPRPNPLALSKDWSAGFLTGAPPVQQSDFPSVSPLLDVLSLLSDDNAITGTPGRDLVVDEADNAITAIRQNYPAVFGDGQLPTSAKGDVTSEQGQLLATALSPLPIGSAEKLARLLKASEEVVSGAKAGSAIGRAASKIPAARAAAQAAARQAGRLPAPVRAAAKVGAKGATYPVRHPIQSPFVFALPQAATSGDPGGALKDALTGQGLYADILSQTVGSLGKLPGEAVSLPAAVVPSVFMAGKAGVNAVQGDPAEAEAIFQEWKDTGLLPALANAIGTGDWGHVGKVIGDHPLYAGLEASGAANAAGRVVGAGLRAVPGRNWAGLEREDLFIPGTKIRVGRQYSRDAFRQMGQRYYDRKGWNEVKPGSQRAAHYEKQAANRFTTDQETVRRLHARERIEELQDVLPKKWLGGRKLDRASAEAVPLAVERILQDPSTFADDLPAYKRLIDKAANERDENGRPLLNKEEMKRNRENAKIIDDALKSGNPAAVVKAADAFIEIQKPILEEMVELGLITEERAAFASALPWARIHMGAEWGQPTSQVSKVVNEAIPEDSRLAAARTLASRARREARINAAAERRKARRQARTAAYDPTPASMADRDWYHGSGNSGLTVEGLDSYGTSPANLFGQGVYLTSKPNVARDYSRLLKPGHSRSPTIYKAKIDPKGVLDLEAKADPRFTAILKENLDHLGEWQGEELGKQFIEELHSMARTAQKGYVAKNRNAYRAYETVLARHAADYFGGNAAELTETQALLTHRLREAGIDVLTHKGGKGMGGVGDHQVAIVLDPADMSGHGQPSPVIKFSNRAYPPAHSPENLPLNRVPSERERSIVEDGAPEGEPTLIDKDGRAITMDQIVAEMRRRGVEPPGFLSHKAPRAGDFYQPAFGGSKLDSKSRSGASVLAGMQQGGIEGLVRQLRRSQGLVDRARGWNEVITQFGMTLPGVKTYADARKVMDDPAHYGLRDGQEVMVVPRYPFNAAKDEIEGALSHQDPIAVDEGAGAFLNQQIDALHAGNLPDDTPIALVPRKVGEQLRKDAEPSGTELKALQAGTNLFKRAVLPFSPSFYIGNVFDNYMRTLMAGVTPLNYPAYAYVAHKAMKEMSPERREQINQGALYSSVDRLSPHRSVENVAQGTGSVARTMREMAAWTHKHGIKQAVIKAAPKALAGTSKAFLAMNRLVSERLPTYGLLGKQIAQDIRQTQGSWVKAIAHFDDAVKDWAKGVDDPAKRLRLQKQLETTLGNYSQMSPAARKVLSNVVPFWTWMRAAYKYVYLTMPAHRSVQTGLLAATAMATQVEREQHGLEKGGLFEPQVEGEVDSWQQGGIPFGDNQIIPWAGYNSFGYAADPTEAVSRAGFAQIKSAVDALGGVDWRGNPIPQTDRIPAAIAAAFGAAVPGFNQLFRTNLGTITFDPHLSVPKAYDKQEVEDKILVPAGGGESSGDSGGIWRSESSGGGGGGLWR